MLVRGTYNYDGVDFHTETAAYAVNGNSSSKLFIRSVPDRAGAEISIVVQHAGVRPYGIGLRYDQVVDIILALQTLVAEGVEASTAGGGPTPGADV